jgi:hypothetical protein
VAAAAENLSQMTHELSSNASIGTLSTMRGRIGAARAATSKIQTAYATQLDFAIRASIAESQSAKYVVWGASVLLLGLSIWFVYQNCA